MAPVKPADVDWKSVDWNMTDAMIAIRNGCSRERVRQQRIKLGMKQSVLYRCTPKVIRMLRDTVRQPLDQVVANEPGYMRSYYRRKLKMLISRGGHRVIQ